MKVSIGESVSCFDSEDMVDKAYTGMLACIELLKPNDNGYIEHEVFASPNYKKDGSATEMDHFFSPILGGVYIPGSVRNYWCGFVDPADHPLPENGSVYITPTAEECYFETLSFVMIKNPPRQIVFRCREPAVFYKTYRTFFRHGKLPGVTKSYLAVDHLGFIYQGAAKRGYTNRAYNVHDVHRVAAETTAQYSAGAISLIADRKHLWNVQTKEKTDVDGLDATINFGVEPDVIKSLLFARDEPMTDSGRKRPILHWVRSHKRRVAKKIDIEIEKHLRGIETFKMGDLTFTITNPQKGIKRSAS